MNSFPYEILEIIASFVSTRDQYTGLTICKAWYLPFCRSLYRHIHLTTRSQLKKFLLSSNNTLPYHGQWIRTLHINSETTDLINFKTEDCITGAIPLSPIQVGVTFHELTNLIQYSPLLQSFDFDHRLWHFINTAQLVFPSTVSSLPALDHPRQLCLLEGQNMIQKLHLRGSDIFKLHQQALFLDSLKKIPQLTEFILDGDGMWDTEHIMHFTINDMIQLHLNLPKLKKLNISDAIHLTITSNGAGQEQLKTQEQNLMRKFQLLASVDCLETWSCYFSLAYPLLTHLKIKLTSRHPQKTGLTQWFQKLNHLKVLDIHPSMAKDFMDQKTLISTGSLVIETLNTGVWGHDINTSVSALNWLMESRFAHNIKKLVVPIWSSDKMELSGFKSLLQLELSCLQRDTQTYAIDTILDSCSHLNHLELNWGSVSVTNLHNSKHQQHPLKTFRLNGVCIIDSNVFPYISMRCHQMHGLFMRRCTGLIELNMLNSNFKYIVISELLLQTKIVTYLKLIQFQKLELNRKSKRKTKEIARYYRTFQDPNTFQTRLQRLSIEQQELSVLCGSVDQFIFNGCRI
ncbi:hypothetical protein BD770DRAFT_141052 [Pilaira anomala]|nr:hypothetical protein BD770DRAFT_141052 [Pilaira anomala]